MLENIHAHWKRKRVCKIKCKGVCTVDMDNVCDKLEVDGVNIFPLASCFYCFVSLEYCRSLVNIGLCKIKLIVNYFIPSIGN